MQFQGFDVPRQNYFKVPNNWTDITASMRSWSEHKVVEYVLRHTWGYSEYGKQKRITLDEFENGRKRRDGIRMDRGIGMSRPSIISGIKQAVADGYLTVTSIWAVRKIMAKISIPSTLESHSIPCHCIEAF